jgi:hypothetical protein
MVEKHAPRVKKKDPWSRLDLHPLLSQVKVKCDLTEPLTLEDWELD